MIRKCSKCGLVVEMGDRAIILVEPPQYFHKKCFDELPEEEREMFYRLLDELDRRDAV